MANIIRYNTSYGSTPSNVVIALNQPLTSVHLPTLSADGYAFLGWSHSNSAGHTASLSERMVIPTTWWALYEDGNYYVTFTANWRTERLPDSGGEGGTSITHEWDGTVLKVTSASGTSSADLKGDNGISVSHSWNKSTLTITSASGTSEINFLDIFYPVGSIMHRYDTTDPSTLFGGTWERIKGAFLWATDSGEIGSTGGEQQTTLQVKHLPSSSIVFTNIAENEWSTGRWRNDTTNTYPAAKPLNQQTALEYGQPHNNMPPYIQVYVWRRTA